VVINWALGVIGVGFWGLYEVAGFSGVSSRWEIDSCKIYIKPGELARKRLVTALIGSAKVANYERGARVTAHIESTNNNKVTADKRANSTI
jgi:hypothetical protein